MKGLFKFSVVFLLIVIILTSIFLYIEINKPYSEIINYNWSINLPTSYKEIYSIDSGASFHGDGERYHIFQYAKESDINKSVNWENNKDKSMETEIDKVLSSLNVQKENMPNFQINYKYYTTRKDDNSKIYLIFTADSKKLYVVEDIF